MQRTSAARPKIALSLWVVAASAFAGGGGMHFTDLIKE